MEFTNPGLLGPAEKFRQRYAIPIERAADEDATARLRRITGPFILLRLKTDKSIISDLPDKLETWFGAVAVQAGPGKTVAVVGDGAVGLLAVLAAKQPAPIGSPR